MGYGRIAGDLGIQNLWKETNREFDCQEKEKRAEIAETGVVKPTKRHL